MNSFDYVRPATRRRGGRGRGRAGLRLSRRRHQPARPDEGRRRAAERGWSTSPGCPASTGSSACPTAASGSARWCATPTSPTTPASRAPIRRSPRRCCPAPRRSCATPRPSAATCCSARAAPISTTPPAPATGASPGAGCDARGGENRLHAVLGWSERLHRHAPVGLLRAARRARRRRRDRGPGGPARGRARRAPPPARRRRPERESVLDAGRADRRRCACRRRRRALRGACPLPEAARAHLLSPSRVVSAAGGARASTAARSAEARLALGGVAAKPWRARAAEAGARRRAAPTRAAFARAAEAALAEARPSGDNAFKIELARRIVVRALTLAAAGTPERMPALPGLRLRSDTGAAMHA